MAIARSGVIWRRVFLLLLALVTLSYVRYANTGFPHGGSPWGLAYGFAGLFLILLLAFFGVRKRAYRSTFGTLEQWLQSHIYLGILVLVVLLFHTGGRFNDRVAVAALILLTVVVVSGIAGAVLYTTVPRLLTEVESNLTADEISEQLNALGRAMARLASGRSAPFQKIYDDAIRRSTPGPLVGWRLLLASRRRDRARETADWSRLLALVPKSEQEELRQMLVLSRQRGELLLRLIYQQRYKNVLEAWLYIHVPVTIALLVVTAVHVAAVFYYGRMPW